MTFSFDSTIPAANNNPSDDQPIMLANNVSDEGIWDVDHVGYDVPNGGQHKLVRFNVKALPAAPTDPQSALYTNNGTASTNAQLFFRNQDAILPISLIRAWAFCSAAGTITASQSNNVFSVVRNSAGNFTVTLTAGATSSVNYGVLVSCGLINLGIIPLTANYAITSQTTFNLTFGIIGAPADPATFTFLVLQI